MNRLPPQTRTRFTVVPGYDPEKVCEYTGQSLWRFPITPELAGYFRADGYLLATATTNPEERAWIVANRQAWETERAQVLAWSRNRQPLETSPPAKP